MDKKLNRFSFSPLETRKLIDVVIDALDDRRLELELISRDLIRADSIRDMSLAVRLTDQLSIRRAEGMQLLDILYSLVYPTIGNHPDCGTPWDHEGPGFYCREKNTEEFIKMVSVIEGVTEKEFLSALEKTYGVNASFASTTPIRSSWFVRRLIYERARLS